MDEDAYLNLILGLSDDVTVESVENVLPGRVADLDCPDCLKCKLTLKQSKYGPFYGCTSFEDTGCKGAVSADDEGYPRGIPAPAATRALRKQAMALYERLKKQRGANAAATVYGSATKKPMGMLNEDEARTVVHVIRHDLGERDVWARLLEED